MGDVQTPSSFAALPLELRSMIYSLVYTSIDRPWILLDSTYDYEKRQDVFRRRSSRDLRGALSLNRTCQGIHSETQQQLTSILKRAALTISLLTYADDHVYISFCESYIGELVQHRHSRRFGDHPLFHHITTPPGKLESLRLRFQMYGVHWSRMKLLLKTFPTLKNLQISVSAFSMPNSRYAVSQQGPYGYQSVDEFYSQPTIVAYFMHNLHIQAAVSGGFKGFSEDQIGSLRLVAAHLKHLNRDADDWELDYSNKACKYDQKTKVAQLHDGSWHLLSVNGDRGREHISWKYLW